MNVNNGAKLSKFRDDLNNLKKFEDKLFGIFISEFEEKFDKILLLRESEFMKQYEHRIKLIMEDIYSIEAFENRSFNDLLLKIHRILYEDYYKVHFSNLEEYSSFEPSLFSQDKLIPFNKHCRKKQNKDIYPYHNCRSQLYPILNSNEEEIIYVVCLDCKLVYLPHSVLMYCTNCQCDFYTAILSKSENIDILPATWDKYHCSALINDQMRCIKCTDFLFIKQSSNTLFCKKCKFEGDPLSIVWGCMLCKQEFKSDAKVYNKLEYKLIKTAIKEALLFKESAKPSCVPCCRKINIAETTFFHKKECNGILYYSNLIKGRPIVVCEKCKMMNDYDKFIWTCPNCLKRYKQKEKNVDLKETKIIKDVIKEEKEDSDMDMDNSSGNDNPLSQFGNRKKTSPPFSMNNMITNIKGNIIERPRGNTTANSSYKGIKPVVTKKIGSETDLIELGKRVPESSPIKRKNTALKVEINTENEEVSQYKKKPLIGGAYINKMSRSEEKPLLRDLPYSVESRGFQPFSALKKNHLQGESIREASPEMFKNLKIDYSDEQTTNYSNNSNNTYNNDDSEDEDLENSVLQDFKIQEQIGEGSYGKIYHVKNTKTNKSYTLKKIIAEDEDEINTIYKEYELVNSVSHTGILKIHKTFIKNLDSTTFALYILMDLAICDWDKEIKKRQISKKYYSEQQLITLLKQLTSALMFLQKKNISHRDIKPQNILIFDKDVYKLADFGEAKEIIRRKKSQTDTLRGTELYMSPILFYALQTNRSDILHNCFKSDVYSIALSLLYAATLVYHPIYDLRECNDMRSMNAILNRYLCQRYSHKVVNLLSKMLEFNENNRLDFIMLDEYLNIHF